MAVYVVESINDNRELGPAFSLHGNEEELTIARKQFTSAALEAVSRRMLNAREAISLLEEITSDYRTVTKENSENFLAVLHEASFLSYVRREKIVEQASKGLIAASAVVEELRIFDDYHGEPLRSPSMIFISKQGFNADIEGNQNGKYSFKPFLLDIEKLGTTVGEKSHAVVLAGQMAVTHFGYCYEVIQDRTGASLQSEREHIVLGVIESDQRFEPLVTVLSDLE